MEASFLSSLSKHSDPAHPIADAIFTRHHPSFSTLLHAYIHNLRFSTPSTPKPFLILTALHPSHVRAAVLAASSHPQVQLKIRSGGHDYEGRSYASDEHNAPFFILDMCHLRAIHLHLSSRTAWVQCGATLGELFHRISSADPTLAFPAGVCPTVGVGGHFVGGGYGNLMRKYGLSVDNILDALLVDAAGRTLDRQSMGEDLFWAIRGGGASFGVVLAYKIKLVPVPPLVTVFRVYRTVAEHNATEAVHAWQRVAPTVDRDLFIRLVLDVITTPQSVKTVRAAFIGMYLGRKENLLSLVGTTFPELALEESDCLESSWIETIPFWADMPEGTRTEELVSRRPYKLFHLKRKSDYVQNPIPRRCLEEIWEKMVELEVVKMGFNPYGGRMWEIAPEATPFPHRAGNLWKIQYQINWTEVGEEAERRHLALCRKLYDYMTPYVSKGPRGAFLNYKDIDLGVNGHRGEGSYEEARVGYGRSYFKGNFEKLVRIKSRVDPGNLFRHEQSVPRTTTTSFLHEAKL